jgi:hypothetical protein
VRRLLLTGEGEQLLGNCRGLLSYVSALGERAQRLQRGDTGVLKVAASRQLLESVVSNFLHHYAERYPNVQVKLINAIGSDILPISIYCEVIGASSRRSTAQRRHNPGKTVQANNCRNEVIYVPVRVAIEHPRRSQIAVL